MRDTDWRPAPCPVCGEMRDAAEKPVCLNAGCGKKEVPGFDPYTNRIQFAMLTDEEKSAMKATDGPWEYFDYKTNAWRRVLDYPEWFDKDVYRAVRRPLPVPQEGDVWVSPTGRWFTNGADDNADVNRSAGWRLFREVKHD